MGQADTLGELQRRINASRWKVTVCPRKGHGNKACDFLGIGGGSVLGSLIDQTGGLVVADGFVKHLGGDNVSGDSLIHVNGLDDTMRDPLPSSLGALVVAVDAFCGLFAIPSQVKDANQATVRYLPYDSMLWEDTRLGHGQFVAWTMGDSARDLYPNQTGCDMVRGTVLRYDPPLWLRSLNPTRKPVPTVVKVADVVRERAGLACALIEATSQGVSVV